MEDRTPSPPYDLTHTLARRVGPPVVALALVEAALYVVLDRSATLHDLYRSPALIALIVAVLVIALRLRGRHGGDRRHAATRRHEARRDQTNQSDDPSTTQGAEGGEARAER